MVSMISCVSGTVGGRSHLLKPMVESIRQSVGTLPYEIVLVAGNCEPDTLRWIKNQGDCVLIEETNPSGAVAAFNLGFANVSAGKNDYVAALNDDIAVEGDTLRTAATYLDDHPEVGQVAFYHKYQNSSGARKDGIVQRMLGGYIFGQCCMTRKWIGDRVKWWGDYGLVFYGGDNHLSCGVWHMGYAVHAVPGCSVLDWEYDDATREKYSRQMKRDHGGVHPDSTKWRTYWNGKLPSQANWIPAYVNPVLSKSFARNLRTLRFQGVMELGSSPRPALIDVFAKYGPVQQANHTWAMTRYGQAQGQKWFIDVAKAFQPDLIMLQAQIDNNILPGTVMQLRNELPRAYIFNWDGDTHYPMRDFHWKIADACHLQLTLSPDLFPWYNQHGVYNVGYWPIGVERDFMLVDRYDYFDEADSDDVLFLGSLYSENYPEANMRRDAVKLLWNSRPGIRFGLYGIRWDKIGIKVGNTVEDFGGNPVKYCKAKMALSISQTKDYWGYTSDRTYNIMATGCPVLIQKFRGMEEHGLVDGDTCISWETLGEMMEKVRYYKAHPGEREAIGKAGREVLLARHTWDTRVEELFGLIARLGE